MKTSGLTDDLPTGRRGQILAASLTLAVLAACWASIAAPIADWYDGRADLLEGQQALADRMQALAEQGPALKAQSVTLISHANGDTSVAGSAAALLDGATDAVAGATLQEAVQIMAGQTGTSITSAETLPGMAAGGWRRIGVRVSIRASWPALIQLLQSIEQGVPRMLVDDVQLHAPPVPPDPAVARAAGVPIDASFSVYAFRLATAERP